MTKAGVPIVSIITRYTEQSLLLLHWRGMLTCPHHEYTGTPPPFNIHTHAHTNTHTPHAEHLFIQCWYVTSNTSSHQYYSTDRSHSYCLLHHSVMTHHSASPSKHFHSQECYKISSQIPQHSNIVKCRVNTCNFSKFSMFILNSRAYQHGGICERHSKLYPSITERNMGSRAWGQCGKLQILYSSLDFQNL